jgi:hypothetical protein
MTMTAMADAQISLASPLVAEPKTAGTTSEFVPSPAVEAQWDRLLHDLRRLRGLQDDWDGQGAQALNPANVDKAVTWVQDMRSWHRALPPTDVLPGTLGEVVLEWRGDAYHIAAEISTPSRIEWLLNLPDQPIKQWETDADRLWIVRSER